MILDYSLFLLESNYENAIKDYGTVGRWIEDKVKDNDYLKAIISPFLIDIDPDIRIANAIELISEFDKKQVFNMVWNYLNRKLESSQDDIVQGGKMIFKSFLKSLTSMNALKLRKIPNKNFIIYYESEDVDDDLLMGSFSRFKSLSYLFNTQSEGQKYRAFYGLDSNKNIVYGLVTLAGIRVIGSFRLTKSSLDLLKSLSSQSFTGFKMDIMSLSIENIDILQKIFKFMSIYPLGDKEKFEPTLNNGILTFSYYGISKWSDGVIDTMEYENIKNNLKTRLSSESWSSKILLNVSTSDSFYVKVNFKLK